MNRFLNYLLVLVPIFSYAQDFTKSMEIIREAETKAALNKMFQRVNMNTGNYDVTYHRLELNVDPSQAFISGDVTTYFEAKENLSEVTFELTQNMVVSEVLQRGNPLSFVQNSEDEVVIALNQVQNVGVLDSLTISYSGNPVSSGFGSFEQNTHNGDPIIWTLSEPYGAKGWWPCKQDLIDKIDSIDIYITTPVNNPSNEEYVAVANGLEQSQTIIGTNKTTHFKHQYPIPAYLVAIAVTNYSVYSHTVENNGNPFEIVNYVYPENLASAQASTPVTVDIMDLFSNLFQEYPYASEKYGHAQFGWGGGMEHTTVSFMGSFGRGLIAHELAHQWFGDKVTCGSWKDIWLNEGFATYLSGLVVENLDGNNSFINWKNSLNNSITSQNGGAVYLTDSDTLNIGRIFSSRLSYNKGAMVTHMLRKKVGDANFFQGMQNYLNDSNLSYGYAKTEDYKQIMETTSGQDLTEFFSDWVYNQGYPSYSIEWHQPSTDQIRVSISQTQSHSSVSYFEAPVPIRVIGTSGGVLDLVLNNTVNNEMFLREVTFPVDNIIFDPEKDIISRYNTVTLGIKDVDLDIQFNIYPNPTKQSITISKPENITVNKINVYNTIGQLLFTTPWSSQLDFSSLSTGLFFLQIHTNKGIINKSVLKN
ncbi:M1 family aminopeptidase [Xanthomarina sp. F2636L]|uniref:M1 family aminopeptidase n=1 Tax=Xanthomarina sp. F2636L TaxID=2996018 RepID=UPI00225DF6E5|nr:M1 family aminopeptidase [Xanthomarina sp. F2636L]MCX7551441.1 M1 family aminopeptidase [Xanthomarina sp. F2636L]